MKKIVLLGYGTVGSGVYELIDKNKNKMKNKFGTDISIEKILVRDLSKYKNLPHKNLFTDRFQDLKSINADVAIEVMGGISPAYDYLKDFLNNGVSVITANKDLIAEYGEELYNISKKNDLFLKYEASVGGGIPVIKAIQESLAGNRFNSILAIINGTTNFILTKMNDENMDYHSALKLAQQKGFAESNPTADVEGYDAVRKLAIMSSLAYGKRINWSTIPTEGISEIETVDIKSANHMDCKVKLMAISKFENDSFYGAVRPVFVKSKSQFSNINNEFNGVALKGDSVGEVHLLGKGAGKFPTASAIVGDLFDVLGNTNPIKDLSFDNGYISHSTYPEKSKWIVRASGVDSSEISSNISHVFSEDNFEIMDISLSKTIVCEVSNIDENSLIKKLNMLFSSPFIEKVKYFMMIE